MGCDGSIETRIFGLRYFNPRTPVGCDDTIFSNCHNYEISIHAPQWGATGVIRLAGAVAGDFNPRTPVGCDPGEYRGCRSWDVFQSTHPSGVRLYMTRRQNRFNQFQSTHPSGVRRLRLQQRRNRRTISIHAPQWGATRMIAQAQASGKFQSTHPSGVRPVTAIDAIIDGLFQSTHPSGVRPAPRTMQSRPTRYFNPRTPVGCDRCRRYGSPAPSNFNPRTPVGCDLHIKCRLDLRRAISIHAPQWGATWMAGVHDQPCGFQSTHPSGVRLCPSLWRSTAPYFNPRTPVGCDGGHPPIDREREISIHAPQWGATCFVMPEYSFRRFQSTHPSGVRRPADTVWCWATVDFNPRTPVGCDSTIVTLE